MSGRWPFAATRQAASPKSRRSRRRGAALGGTEVVVTTGWVLQALLQGLRQPKAQAQISASRSALALIQPDRDDHIDAAGLRNACRASGVRIETIDAVIAQLRIRHGLTLLSTDKDFMYAAERCTSKLWPGQKTT